jgi:hypothetical protein
VEHGGPDELDNLCLLCIWCHRQWHHIYEKRGVPFADWLRTTPEN